MTLRAFAGYTHIEVRFPLGGRIVMTSAAYAAMSAAQLAGTHARLLNRVELIAAMAVSRRS